MRWKWLAAVSVLLATALIVGPWLAAEPLRRLVERRVNERARGFSVSIGALHLHLLQGSIDEQDLVVIQDAHPEPPVVSIAALSASVQWLPLLRGRLVGRVTLDRPVVYVDRPRLERERRDPDRRQRTGGWQRRVQRIHPIRIAEVTVRDGSFTYIDGKRHRPLTITRIAGVTRDIDTRRRTDEEYPSPVHATGIVFGDGDLALDGHADFLRDRHVAVRGRLTARHVALDYFAPSAAKHRVALVAGTVSGTGELEFAPTIRRLAAETARIDGVRADYRYRKGARPIHTHPPGKPRWLMTARTLEIRGANVGVINEDARPAYRVFLSDTDVDVENFINRPSDELMRARLTGRFMGSGMAFASAAVRAKPHGADLDLEAAIEDTDLRTLNDVLRAHAKLDVMSGFFSVYADGHVRQGSVKGWVEPLFRQVKAYDPDRDTDRPLTEKLRKRLVDLANRILRNERSQEVTTRVSIDGPLPDPRADTREALFYLVQNAFSRAILPGVEPGRRPLAHLPRPAKP